MTGYIKYSFVGALGAAINFVSLWLLTDNLHLWYLLSACIGILLAATANFVLNYLFTFRGMGMKAGSRLKGWAYFVLAVVPFDGIYLGLVYVLTSKLGVYYMVSALISALAMNVPKYIIAKKWLWFGDAPLSKLEILEAGIE